MENFWIDESFHKLSSMSSKYWFDPMSGCSLENHAFFAWFYASGQILTIEEPKWLLGLKSAIVVIYN